MNTHTTTDTQVQNELPMADEMKPGALQVLDQQAIITAPTPSPFERMMQAAQAGIPLEQVREMMALQAEWEKGEALKAFNRAFAAFKAENVEILKRTDRTAGPLKGTKYANLADILSVVTEPLAKHGLSVTWRQTIDQRDWLEVECVVKHNLGHCETQKLGGPPDGDAGGKNPLQSRGSTITYLARYTVKMALGLAEEDDDDDGAGGPVTRPKMSPEMEKNIQGWKDYLNDSTTAEQVRERWPAVNKAWNHDGIVLKELRAVADARRFELNTTPRAPGASNAA